MHEDQTLAELRAEYLRRLYKLTQQEVELEVRRMARAFDALKEEFL